jgi:Uma2 family endonuclease
LERVDEYLACGVPVVWVVSPLFHTVSIHRLNAKPVALDAGGTLRGDPELPGFACRVADFFR